MIEIWRQIPGYPKYEVSTLGNVRHVKHKRILKGGTPGNGYRQVHIFRNGKGITKCVHQLMALTFLGLRPDGYDINHKDHDKTNNRLDNLEYIPRSENVYRKHPKRFCAICNKQLGAQKVTCSQTCNHLLHTVELTCVYCGGKFRRYKSQFKRARRDYPNHGENVFCSKQCQGAWLYENFGPGNRQVLQRQVA